MKPSPKFILPPNQCLPEYRHPDAPKKSEPYIACEDLVTAVNLAIYLRRPLLLEGEAGCGKSRLAWHVADELGLPLKTWLIRSSSKADEGLYTYDSILRLHDVQLRQWQNASAAKSDKPSSKRDPENSMDYVRFGALGEAFQLKECPAVVLIDEIDKADIDFPNDLLSVLDKEGEFHIPECDGPPIQAIHPPIVIITSNKEKGNLPAPFLRRCVYFYIGFPDDKSERMKWLKTVVDAHYKTHESPPSEDLVDAACERFWAVRDAGDPHKKPSTSEFLDWLEVLRGFPEATQAKSSPRVAGIVERLKQLDSKLPYPELLFKIQEDWRHAARA